MDELHAKNKRTLFAIVSVVVFMVGVSFAAVPLYTLFCQVTGFEGTIKRAESLPDKVVDREIKVLFDSRVQAGLPWKFGAERHSMTVKIGQKGLIAFQAENLSDAETAGTAIYNVTPKIVGKYFQKTQCFCFELQSLGPRKVAHMPVVFFIDPDILKDPELDNITDITLSYTFFPAESKALEKALRNYSLE